MRRLDIRFSREATALAGVVRGSAPFHPSPVTGLAQGELGAGVLPPAWMQGLQRGAGLTFSAKAENDREPSFGDTMKQIRRRILAKQVSLSERVGCTDAAISLWESGARLPTRQSFARILIALEEEGATIAELLALRGAWQREAEARATNRKR